MTMVRYLPYEAAEIVKLCLAAGVPEQAVDWLADGYTLSEVAANLQASARSHPATSPVRQPAAQNVSRPGDVSAELVEKAAQQRFAIQRHGRYSSE